MPTPVLDRVYRPEALSVPVLTARDGPIAAINPNLTTACDRVDASAIDQAVASAVTEDARGAGRGRRGPGGRGCGGLPGLGAGVGGRWHGAVRKDPGCRRALCRARPAAGAGSALGQFGVGLLLGQRRDLWPGGPGRAGGQECVAGCLVADAGLCRGRYRRCGTDQCCRQFGRRRCRPVPDGRLRRIAAAGILSKNSDLRSL